MKMNEDEKDIRFRLSHAYDSAAAGLRPTDELEWLACDRRGNVAVFCTAGFGCTPNGVLSGKATYVSAIVFVRTMAPPPGGGCAWLSGRVPEGTDVWRTIEGYALRGLHYYDYQHKRCADPLPYSIEARPAKPLVVDECPPFLQEYLSLTRFSSLCFEESENIILEKTEFRSSLV